MVEEGVILEHCHRVLCAEETSLIFAQSYNANSAIESAKPAVKADAVKSVNQDSQWQSKKLVICIHRATAKNLFDN